MLSLEHEGPKKRGKKIRKEPKKKSPKRKRTRTRSTRTRWRRRRQKKNKGKEMKKMKEKKVVVAVEASALAGNGMSRLSLSLSLFFSRARALKRPAVDSFCVIIWVNKSTPKRGARRPPTPRPSSPYWWRMKNREREREKTRKATKHADPRGKKNNILLFFFFFLRPLFIISSSSFPFSCFPVCFFLRRTGLEPKEKRSSRAPPSPTPPPSGTSQTCPRVPISDADYE